VAHCDPHNACDGKRTLVRQNRRYGCAAKLNVVLWNTAGGIVAPQGDILRIYMTSSRRLSNWRLAGLQLLPPTASKAEKAEFKRQKELIAEEVAEMEKNVFQATEQYRRKRRSIL